MKQKRFRKIVSIICVLALVFSSITAWDVTKAFADASSEIILKSDTSRESLLNEIANSDYNFALNKNATASKVTGGNNGGTDLTVITNGEFATSRSATTTVTIGQKIAEDKWVQVDLKNAYDTSKIDRIAVQYWSLNTSARAGYKILYSLNGIDFVEVGSAEAYTSASGNPIICLDHMTLTEEQKQEIPFARFVRVVATSDNNNTNNGLQVMGMAVLTDGTTKVSDVGYQEVENLDDPVSLTVTSSDYEQLEYIFEASAKDTGDYTYYAYIDGTQVEEAVEPQKRYVVTGLTGGSHTVKIVAQYSGLYSEGITETVNVTDTKDLLTDERNFAVGKIATASSIRDNDLETNITDGNITSLFRTLATDTESTIVIDLGANYKLDVIERTVALYATGRYPKNYTIDYSSNGLDYQTVATATGTSEVQSVLIDPADCDLPGVRYVRFSLSNPVGAGFGFQMYELGIILKEDADLTPVEIEMLDDPESLTVTSSDYGQLEYQFTASKNDEGDYTYFAYIDGKKETDSVYPDTKYTKTGLLSGNHTVKIVAINAGLVSEGITEVVQVSDPKELISTDRNMALGRTAVSSSTRVDIVNDQEVPDDITKLTDGDLKTQFRTLQTDPEASIVIDLGSQFKLNIIELVAMSYIDNRYAKEYSIDYSQDGEYFETVCTGTGNSTFQYSKINPSECTLSTVRYVRINVSKPFAEGYGFQFYEIAVISKDKSLDDTEITLNKSEYTYTGDAILPDVTITFGDKTLEKDKDYVVKCTDNVNVGNATAVLEGAGSYSGSKTLEYKITPANMNDVDIVPSFDDDGELLLSLTYYEKELVENQDYTYTTEKNSDGDMLIKVEAAGNNFTGTKEKVVPITEFPVVEVANVSVTSTELNTIDVSFENPNTFAGDRQLYDVYIDEEIADEDVVAGEYSYDDMDAGEHQVKVVAKINGQTSDGVEQSVTVNGIDVADYKIVISLPENAEEFVYTGEPIIPACSVVNEDESETLAVDEDYTISFENNTNAGTAKVVVKGIGLFEGTVEAEFEIQPKEIVESDVDFTKVAKSYTYLGKPIEPEVSIEGLAKDVDYTVSIEGNNAPGTAKITITGIGNYKGIVSKEFTIEKKIEPTTQSNPTTTKVTVGKSKIVSASKKKSSKKLSVKFKAVKKATKYQIVISVKKNGKKYLVKKTVKKTKITIVNKKLANKKKLYIKVRAIRVVKGKTYYGKWSNTKSVKIK